MNNTWLLLGVLLFQVQSVLAQAPVDDAWDQNVERVPSILGKWKTDCLPIALNNKPEKKSLAHPLVGESWRTEVTFVNNASVEFKKYVFSDTGCKVLTHEVTWGSTYTLPQPGQINFVMDSATITTRTKAQTDEFNKNYCVYQDEKIPAPSWRVNKPNQVANVKPGELNCGGSPFGVFDFTAFNIYNVWANALELDFDRPGFSPDGRPTAIEKSQANIFRRVK